MGGKGTILSCIQSSLTLCMCEYNVCIDRDHMAGADAGFRVRGGAKCRGYQGRTQDLELGGRKWRIQDFSEGGA